MASLRILFCLWLALIVEAKGNNNNILLIIADDYGLDASALYNTSPGVSLAPTPNIASLAANGVRFTNAYSYTVCSPSRSAILTGRFGFRTGTGNVNGGTASNNSLQASEFTLPDAFAANPALGYQLKHIGKWHLGGGQTAPCLIGGWPSFAGALIGEITNFTNWTKVTGSGATASASTVTTYATTENVNDAIAFIGTQEAAKKPWFTWVAFNAPHIPYHLPSPTSLCPHYASLSGTDADIAANPRNYFNAAIEAMDTEIGRLLAAVDLNTTTVIFIGDNGTAQDVLQAPYPTNRGKGTLYEGGIRVPLIIRGPGVVAPGRTSDVLTHFVDLYSTILELAGINVATTMPAGVVLDSKSLLPILQNQSSVRNRVYGELFDLAFPTLGGRTLRNERYKLIRPISGSETFYDLQVDPYEGTNLLASGVNAMPGVQQSAYNQLVSDLATYSTTAPTAVNSITRSPLSPAQTDAVVITANVTPGAATTIASVALSYSTGAQSTSTVFRETFSSGSTASGLAGALNTWSVTAVRNAADVKQRGSTGNRTTPILLSNCTTTSASNAVTCASTAGLWAGMSVSGTNIAASAFISAVPNATTLVLSTAATGNGSGLTLTAAGVSLTGCSLVSTPTIACASTTGLSVGMGITGTGLTANPPTPSVLAITDATHFTLSSTVTAVPVTLTASGCGLEFTNGTSTATDTMATTNGSINAAGATAGNIEFYVRTADLVSNNGWAFQVSPDGGTTWTTRLSENFASATVSNCTLNSGNNQSTGSTTILCANTAALTVGNGVTGSAIAIPGCTTSSTTNPTVVLTPNTSALGIGMFITGGVAAGIPNGARITAISPGVSFTMSAGATASGTAALLGNFLNPNSTISAITANASFTVSTPVFYSGTGIALSAINHGFSLQHYDLAPAELTSGLRMRFQWSGSLAVAPSRPAACDIDDIAVTLTSGAAPVTLAMFDDGAHGDGAAGDGIFGASIPAQAAGATVSYTVTATDSAAATATGSGSYLVAVAAPVLAVTPANTFSSAGALGGSAFSPASLTYTLTNNGTGTMSWTASKTASWLTLSNTSGTLAAGASIPVIASINSAAANALGAALYSDSIAFSNASTGTGNTTRAVSLLVTVGTPSAPAAPVLGALPVFSAGTAKNLSWSGVANATSYTVQIATDAAFTSELLSQSVTSPGATFGDLSDGVKYFYRVLASNSLGTSAYGNTVFSTQDNGAPAVAITSPADGISTTANTVSVSGTSSDGLSGISGVKVNNVAAISSNNFATWSATVPLGFGTNALTATATDGAGNLNTSAAVRVTDTTWQTYNPLIIPDVLTGTTFDLTLSLKSKQFPFLGTNLSTTPTAPSTLGSATTTLGYNGALMWGPTLIMNQGDVVQLNVTNNVPIDTTTVHWHGFHIPAIMDGGPHQVVPSGTTWSPTFTVKNNAATYWYHPHLHLTTQKQLTLGAGGFIIVRDPKESALALPRTYGVDDIPVALTSRRFIAGNQFGANQYVQADGSTSTLDNYGDFMIVNGTPSNVTINGSGAGATATLYPPQITLPKQYVRLRILNAEIQRGYNLGFSDNRTFYVITNDQGLLNAPVPVTRLFLMVGERVEILVNLGSDTLGSALDLRAFNSGQVFGFPGNEGTPKLPTGISGGENGSLLNNTDFNVLHIVVGAATANPITSLPAVLAANAYWTNADVTNTRTIAITGGSGGTPGFKFDNIGFTPTLFNHTINYNAVEKWTVSAGNVFGHSLHIHDIKFNILARTGGTQVSSNGLPASYESGWKDTVYIPKGETVSVLAKFDDFASNTNPFMFHCHFLNHEDGGMMGQFVVVNKAVEDLAIASFTRTGPDELIELRFKATVGTTYTLQYSIDMSSWKDIGSVTSDGTSALFTETDRTRLAQARGFYRVTIPTVP